jgi:TolB-like protein
LRRVEAVVPAGTAVTPPPEPPPPPMPTVAVLDFDNVSGDASLAWLSSGIAEDGHERSPRGDAAHHRSRAVTEAVA